MLIHGLLVSKCHLFIRYNRKIPFTDFIDFVSYNRRLGDADVDKTVIAQRSKLIGKSAFGIQLINKVKFDKTVNVNKLAAKKRLTLLKFKSNDVIDRNIYEMKMSKNTTCHDEPTIVGFVTLKQGQAAKARVQIRFSRTNFTSLNVSRNCNGY